MNGKQVVDLTHDLWEGVPTWDGEKGFEAAIDSDYDEGARVMSYQMVAGVGTHMDSPSHFAKGGASISEIPVSHLVAPLSVLRVSLQPDDFITVEDIQRYEKAFGKIPKKSFVAVDTGWAKYWGDVERYRNGMHFPGFSIEAAHLLLEREIVGLGIDTLSPDGSDMSFPVHHFLLSKGVYFVENLANLDKVPERGATAIVLPPKIRGGAEAPCRCIAIV